VLFAKGGKEVYGGEEVRALLHSTWVSRAARAPHFWGSALLRAGSQGSQRALAAVGILWFVAL